MAKKLKSQAGSKTIQSLLDEVVVWAVLTREAGTYIIGKPPVYSILEERGPVRLNDPVLMKREGSKISFERLDVFDGPAMIDTEGQLAIGRLREPYLAHYLKFLALPPEVASKTS